MFLVTGATGNVGGEVVRALVEDGAAVRGLTRSGGGLPAGVAAVSGDLNRPASLGDALDGVRGIFLLPGYEDMPAMLAAARAAGAERVVLLSGGSAGSGDMSNAITRYMSLSERAVRESGLDWTILRPSGFMSNALEWAAQLKKGDVVRAPFPDVRVAVIDPYDIGAVAARALVDDGHRGQVYRLSGPEALTPADRVRILGEVLGRELRFEGLTDEEARAEMSASMPAAYVDAFFDFNVDGSLDESPVLPTVAEIAGRPPRTFELWAAAHAGSFG